MQISKYSILSKIQLLAAVVYDEDEAKAQKIKLHTTFSKLEMTTDFVAKEECDKIDPEQYMEDVTVNLYQFFNIIDVCDELIDFEVEGDRLKISSFYNQEVDKFEFEAFLDTVPDFDQDDVYGEYIGKLTLDQLTLNSIKNEFHNFKSNGGFFIEYTSRSGLVFKYSERGITSELKIKSLEDVRFILEFSQFISFRVLELLLGSGGGLSGNEISIYENGIKLKSDTLEINYHSDSTISNYDLGVDYEQVCVYENDKLISLLDLVKRASKVNKHPVFYMSINADDELLTVSASPQDHGYGLSAQAVMGINDAPKNVELVVDGHIIFNILKVTGVKFIKLQVDSIGALIIQYKNAVLDKVLRYEHDEWMSDGLEAK